MKLLKFDKVEIKDPHIAWGIIIFSGLFLIIIILARGYIMHKNLDAKLSEALSDKISGDVMAPFDSNSLNRILEIFDIRAVQRSDTLRKYSGLSDPSL